jgi:hypothetical protein
MAKCATIHCLPALYGGGRLARWRDVELASWELAATMAIGLL